MRREGSAFQGLGVVVLKELSDHFASARMRVLEWLVVLTALAAVYGAIQQVRDVTAEDPFLFLRLFTTAREPLPSFVSFLSFLVPLMAIVRGRVQRRGFIAFEIALACPPRAREADGFGSHASVYPPLSSALAGSGPGARGILSRGMGMAYSCPRITIENPRAEPAARHEHGLHPVRSDPGGGDRRNDGQCRPGARPRA